MNLTGQAKKDFEMYIILDESIGELEQERILHYLNLGKIRPIWAYLVDWFDSVGYKVYVMYNEVAHKWNWHIDFKPVRDDCNSYPDYELPEARTEAIEKANEIYNQKHS